MIPNNIKEMNSNPMEKLAFQDAISLISYMYHHAEDILKSSKSLLNQILTTTKEGLSTSWDDIKKTTSGNVEYDLWQMEKQVPEADKFTEEEQGCFVLFLAYKIFRYGNKVCLKYFSEQQPELITKIFDDYPHLFFRREAINICIKNKDGRQKALDAIKLKSSNKFFKDCFDTVFPKVDVVVNLIFEEEPKPKHVPNEP